MTHGRALIARYLGKYIPGNPNFIVQNMPGAGAMIAANYVYKVAKPDGLTLGGIRAGLYFDQLVGQKRSAVRLAEIYLARHADSSRAAHLHPRQHAVQNDSRRAQSNRAAQMRRHRHGVDRLLYRQSDWKKPSAQSSITLTGYKDGPEVELAVEREEVHCRGISVETLFGREPLIGWFKNGFVRVLIQTGKKRDPRLSEVPTIWELMNEYKTPEAGKRLATIILAVGAFGRPYVSSPGLPPERAKILKSAFAKTLNDPDFQAQAKERKLEIDPVAGDELETLAREVIAQPPDVVERMKRLLEK